MRPTTLHTALLLASTASAFQLPSFEPFFAALPISLQDYIPTSLANQTTNQNHDLLRRQYSNTCPTNFNSCSNLGAANLCCAPSAVCSADYAGHVACCPSGSACSGTISGILTVATLNSEGSVVGGTATGGAAGVVAASTTDAAATTATSNNGLVVASTEANSVSTDGGSGLVTTTGGSSNGFIIAGTSTVATPGAGVRAAQVPLIVRAMIKALDYLPV